MIRERPISELQQRVRVLEGEVYHLNAMVEQLVHLMIEHVPDAYENARTMVDGLEKWANEMDRYRFGEGPAPSIDLGKWLKPS